MMNSIFRYYETQKCHHTEEKLNKRYEANIYIIRGFLAPELQNERLLVCYSRGYSIYEETSKNCAKAKKDGH